MTTEFHARHFALALQRKGAAGSIDSIGRSMANARIELHPYQVEAAIFALTSPLRKGVLLADEVGLGKTIEAGLVIAQRWVGLRVVRTSVPKTYRAAFKRLPDPELPEDQHTKLVVDGRIRQDEPSPRRRQMESPPHRGGLHEAHVGHGGRIDG